MLIATAFGGIDPLSFLFFVFRFWHSSFFLLLLTEIFVLVVRTTTNHHSWNFVLSRLVWLVGVLLRGTFQCTAIPKVFNPSMTGWGAGTILGAKCTHQEWIATFMIGWFGSEYYWKYLFGCRGPPFAEPGFTGIPVFITKIRDVRL